MRHPWSAATDARHPFFVKTTPLLNFVYVLYAISLFQFREVARRMLPGICAYGSGCICYLGGVQQTAAVVSGRADARLLIWLSICIGTAAIVGCGLQQPLVASATFAAQGAVEWALLERLPPASRDLMISSERRLLMLVAGLVLAAADGVAADGRGGRAAGFPAAGLLVPLHVLLYLVPRAEDDRQMCRTLRTNPAAAARPALPHGATYFLSGVMGGSMRGSTAEGGEEKMGLPLESQSYRTRIRSAVLAADPTARVIDPLKMGEECAELLYPKGTPKEAMWRDDNDVRNMFADVVDAAAGADVVVSYLPTASMGSACELHAARAAGRLILVIAPGGMAGNWVIRSYSDHVFESIEQLASWLADSSREAWRARARELAGVS